MLLFRILKLLSIRKCLFTFVFAFLGAEAFGQEDIVALILADARNYETRAEERIAGYSKALEKDSLNFQLYFERG